MRQHASTLSVSILWLAGLLFWAAPFLPQPAEGQAVLQHRRGAFQTGGAPTVLVDEGFEGTGYEMVGWTESGSFVEDFTTRFYTGSQSGFSRPTTEGHTQIEIGDHSQITVEFWWYSNTNTSSTYTFIASIRDDGGAASAIAAILTNTDVMGLHDGVGQTNASAIVSEDTWYKVRMVFVDGGTCTLEYNTTGTFDGSGTDYCEHTEPTGGLTVSHFRLSSTGGTGQESNFDDVYVTAP